MASVFFSTDFNNSDTNLKFYADLQMFNFGGNIDPEAFMRNFHSSQIPTKQNKWSVQNAPRWRNAQYDTTFAAAQTELDPAKRAALFIQLNDILVNDGYVIPLANRPEIAAIARNLHAPMSAWSSQIFLIQDWYRDA